MLLKSGLRITRQTIIVGQKMGYARRSSIFGVRHEADVSFLDAPSIRSYRLIARRAPKAGTPKAGNSVAGFCLKGHTGKIKAAFEFVAPNTLLVPWRRPQRSFLL